MEINIDKTSHILQSNVVAKYFPKEFLLLFFILNIIPFGPIDLSNICAFMMPDQNKVIFSNRL